MVKINEWLFYLYSTIGLRNTSGLFAVLTIIERHVIWPKYYLGLVSARWRVVTHQHIAFVY